MATARMARSIATVLDAPLTVDPDHEALVGAAATLTYRQLHDAAGRVARSLWTRGVRPGDVVAASLPNDVDIVIAFHAVMRLGAQWVGINRQLAPAERAYILTDSGAAYLLADRDVVASMLPAPAPLREVVEIARGELAGTDRRWTGEGSDADLADLAARIDPFAPAALAYTSGTTGRPKGVIHSQHNLLLPGAVLVETRGYDASLRKGDCLPLTILNMVVLTTLLTAQCGGTAVIMDRVDSSGIAEWIRRQRIGTWNGVPAMLSSLNTDESVVAEDLASLGEVWVGGDSCPEAIELAFEAKFGRTLTGSYGLTEAPTVVSMDAPGERREPGASGRPLPHLSVTIRDDDGRELPAGEVGDVWIEPRSDGPWAGTYRPMLGYLHDTAATARVLAGDRLHTGDVGAVTSDGRLAIRARRSSLIIRGGANVYPAEVERVMATVPDVRASVVFGVPDGRLGQRVVAAIEVHDGADRPTVLATVGWACATELAKYKVPESIVVVDELPRNAMGKVDRSRLAELAPQ